MSGVEESRVGLLCGVWGGDGVSLATLARTLLKNVGQLMAGKSRRACCHAYCVERTFA